MSAESILNEEYSTALDARLESYDAYIAYQMNEARRALDFLARYCAIPGARVLEIGTGTGGKGIAYARAGMRVTALDVDLAALARAEAYAQAHSAPVSFLAGNGARLPVPDDRFDAVLLDSVIEHVRDPYALLRECYRAVKPNGIVFVVFPPFYGPLSGHIDDYILIPWFHLLPRAWVRGALLGRPRLRGYLAPADAYDVYCTLNGLTVSAFTWQARRAGFRFDYFRVRPFLTHPGMRLVVGLYSAARRRGKGLGEIGRRARKEFTLGTFLLFLLLAAISPLVFIPIAQEIAAGGFKCVLRKT